MLKEGKVKCPAAWWEDMEVARERGKGGEWRE